MFQDYNIIHYTATLLYTRDRCSSLTRPLSQIFIYVNKCSTHRQLVWDISQVYLVLTHKLFITRGINRCMLVK